ncbi:MAG: hypothetical protein WCW35_11850 [Bacteroidota bacterium]
MNKATVKNIVVYFIAAIAVGTAYYFTAQRDHRIMSRAHHWDAMDDSLRNHYTQEEKRIAHQFSDSILPQLKELGLIRSYSRTELETVITVSGTIWRDRSLFFKESLLNQLFVYNKVNGFALNTRIIDNESSVVYAEIIPPDRREIYR